jgi:hypothetical protein
LHFACRGRRTGYIWKPDGCHGQVLERFRPFPLSIESGARLPESRSVPCLRAQPIAL